MDEEQRARPNRRADDKVCFLYRGVVHERRLEKYYTGPAVLLPFSPLRSSAPSPVCPWFFGERGGGGPLWIKIHGGSSTDKWPWEKRAGPGDKSARRAQKVDVIKRRGARAFSFFQQRDARGLSIIRARGHRNYTRAAFYTFAPAPGFVFAC